MFDRRLITATDFCLEGWSRDYASFPSCVETLRLGLKDKDEAGVFMKWKTGSLLVSTVSYTDILSRPSPAGFWWAGVGDLLIWKCTTDTFMAGDRAARRLESGWNERHRATLLTFIMQKQFGSKWRSFHVFKWLFMNISGIKDLLSPREEQGNRSRV